VNDADLRDEIHKRFTLNWLIQGAAQHAAITLHHLVRDELDSLDPALVPLYDEFALINLLQYWSFDVKLLLGSPSRFWKRAQANPKHMFFGHAVLSRYGGLLAAEANQRGMQRCREKGFRGLLYFFPFRAMSVMGQLGVKESRHAAALANIGKRAVHLAWGIPTDRLEADLTTNVAFGSLRPPRTFAGRIFCMGAVGYGGVVRRGSDMIVVGRGTNWQLMTKELVKGTTELICLHGLNQLSDDTYQKVVAAADGVDFEPWMLQTGGELWRRLLAVLPKDRPIAGVLMHIARLPARSLERLMLAVMEEPKWAREFLVELRSN